MAAEPPPGAATDQVTAGPAADAHLARVAVVGGGISGLAAAWRLKQEMPDLQIIVLDASDHPGGKLRAAPVGGVSVDAGAESMLARRPEAVQLAGDVGLRGAIVHPATTTASIWSRGKLHPMPTGTLMGVPSDPAAALGVLSPQEVARAQQDRSTAMTSLEHDVSVGDFVAARCGPAVVDRLVEPLLGGVYAGHARRLSLRATVPALWDASVAGEAPTMAARRLSSAAARDGSPVFAGIVGGLASLASTLVDRLTAAGVQFSSQTHVRELHRTRTGWRLVAGSKACPRAVEVDAAVLATPSTPASRLLSPHCPAAAADLSAIAYASMAIVTTAFPLGSVPPLPGSGFLVPPVERLGVKASTFSSNKWAWLAAAAPDLLILRVSVGRQGEESDLQRSDEDLVRLALGDLTTVLRTAMPPPVDTHVQRWGGGLPQYAVGHVDRVARIRAGLKTLPGVEVAGAAYEGVGIPACIASGRLAADAVLTHLRARAPGP